MNHCDVDDVIINTTTISDQYFRGCTNLTSVDISDSVVYIGSRAFEGCTSLHTVIIGHTSNSNLRTIGDYAFKDCTSLVNLTITSTQLENIGKGVVKGCELL